MKTKYKYIHFEQTVLAGCWNCLNNKSNDDLGSVIWYKPWGQFVFEPVELGDIIFNASCLRDIAHFLDQLNKQKKATGSPQKTAPAASGVNSQ